MAAARPTASAIGGVPASNLAGAASGMKPSVVTFRIMPPPPRNGGMASSSSARPHNTPMPEGPSILWPLKATKSAPMACTSVGRCGTDWQASTRVTAPLAASGCGQAFDRGERAEHVRHRGEGKELRPVEQTVEVAEIELAIVGDGDPTDLEARLGGQHLPRDDVGVVLHDREHDGVAWAEVGPTPDCRPRG